MANLPRPLIGLLVATLVFFAVWTVALKPSSSSGPAAKPSTPAPAPAAAGASKPQPTTSTASHAAGVAKAAPAKAAPAKAAPAKAAPAKTEPTKAAKAAKAAPKPAVKPAASTSERVALVKSALADHKVLAVLFFNPAAADDQAVKRELAHLPVHGGKVVKLAVPLNELAQYPVITNQVEVTESPTLVLIDPQRQADMLTGFVDQLELNQRVANAIASK